MSKPSLLDQLAEELTAKRKKSVKKSTPKFVLEVNGQVLQNRPANKKDLKQAVIAITIKNPQAVINVYKLEGPISVDLPVAGAVLEGDS